MNGDVIGILPTIAIADPAERLPSVFDAHYDRLYRLARRLASNRDDALDLVQETFLRAVRFQASIPAGAINEEAWLVRVLINIRRDQWRKASVRDRLDKAEVERSRLANGVRQEEPALIARSTVWRALDLLPPRRRAIVVMHELEGMPVPAIAVFMAVATMLIAGSFLGWRVWSPLVGSLQAAVRFEMRLAEDWPAPGLREVAGPGRTIYLHDEAIVTNSDIAEARVVRGRSPSQFGVEVKFNPVGAKKMIAATEKQIGKPMAILVDGQLVAAPVLRSVIRESALVNGDFTKTQAERIANGIR